MRYRRTVIARSVVVLQALKLISYLIMNIEIISQGISAGRYGLIIGNLGSVVEGSKINPVQHRPDRHGDNGNL